MIHGIHFIGVATLVAAISQNAPPKMINEPTLIAKDPWYYQFDVPKQVGPKRPESQGHRKIQSRGGYVRDPYESKVRQPLKAKRPRNYAHPEKEPPGSNGEYDDGSGQQPPRLPDASGGDTIERF